MSDEDNGVICTICLDSLKKKKFNHPSYIPPIISLTCSHSYHFGCINSWFTKSCSFLCPVCKYPDKILLENFLPEIKQSLHNEILKSSREFLTDEAYEKYCEDCIKQGNMLKIIERQQQLNSQGSESGGTDDYYEDDIEDDSYLSPIAREHYYQHAYSPCSSPCPSPCPRSRPRPGPGHQPPMSYSYPYSSDDHDLTELPYPQARTTIMDMETIEPEEFLPESLGNLPYPSSSSSSYLLSRRPYFIESDNDEERVKEGEEEETEELLEEDMITYARGVLNCILDDDDAEAEDVVEDEEIFFNHPPYKMNRISQTQFNHAEAKERYHRKRHSPPHPHRSKKRSSTNLNELLTMLTGTEPRNAPHSNTYENILLNTSTKPTFFHKYRFYIISLVFFILGYFLFL